MSTYRGRKVSDPEKLGAKIVSLRDGERLSWKQIQKLYNLSRVQLWRLYQAAKESRPEKTKMFHSQNRTGNSLQKTILV